MGWEVKGRTGRHRISQGTDRRGCLRGEADVWESLMPRLRLSACATTGIHLLYRVDNWVLSFSRFFKALASSQDLPRELEPRATLRPPDICTCA